jgi:hypothetical protein
MSKVVVVKNTITSSLKKIQVKLDKLPQEAYDFYKSITPVRSGNARRNTRFNKSRDEIQAQYAYAQRLDEGYSKQAPQGMSEPTEQFIAKRSKQIIKGK